VADRADRVDERSGELPSARHQHERRRGERVGQVLDQRGGLLGGEPPDVARHHHPPVGEERRGLGGVDHRREGDVLAAELLHHQSGVGVAHQLAYQGLDRVGGHGRVVASDEVGGEDGLGRAHDVPLLAALGSP
jgi:hypothetical protein